MKHLKYNESNMKYIKTYKLYESIDNDDLMNIMTHFVDNQWLPDKDYLYECFSHALDSGQAYFLYDTDGKTGFLDKYRILSTEPTMNAFNWTLHFKYIPKGYSNGVIYKKDRNKFDAVKKYYNDFSELLTYVEECVVRVEEKYDKYKLEVSVNDKTGFISVEVSTEKFHPKVSKYLGIMESDWNEYKYYYNPITYLYKKHNINIEG